MRSRILLATLFAALLYGSSFYSNSVYATSMESMSLETDAHASVSGQVLVKTGLPAAGIEVVAYPARNDNSNVVVPVDTQALARTTVDSGGRYTLTLDYSGAVRIAFYDPNSRYQSEYFDNVPSGLTPDKFAAATDVNVEHGVSVEGVNAELDQFGQARGRVTSVDGMPITGDHQSLPAK